MYRERLPGVPGDMSLPDIQAIESSISRRRNEFDLVSLLGLLSFLGYSPDRIFFKSDNSLCSQSGFIEKIEFKKDPEPEILILLNFGLLSAQSPLPSYFQKNIDAGMMDVQSFYDFIGYFDHAMISGFFHMVYPELVPGGPIDIEQMKSIYTRMLDVKSIATLDWLFKLVFPELEVVVEKRAIEREVVMRPMKLGETVLGENAVFGDRTRTPFSGKRVTLYCNEAVTSMGEPWPRQIKQRLKTTLFPLLAPVGMILQVILVIKSQTQWARLHRDSFLGYDKIRGGSGRFRTIRIFSGYVSDT